MSWSSADNLVDEIEIKLNYDHYTLLKHNFMQTLENLPRSFTSNSMLMTATSMSKNHFFCLNVN